MCVWCRIVYVVPRRVCARVCGSRVLCAHSVDFGGVTGTRVLYRCYSVLCGVPSYAGLQCRRPHSSNNFTDALPRSNHFFPNGSVVSLRGGYRHTRALRTTCPRCGDSYTSDVSSSCGGVTERARYVAVCGTPCSLTVLKRLVWNASRRTFSPVQLRSWHHLAQLYPRHIPPMCDKRNCDDKSYRVCVIALSATSEGCRTCVWVTFVRVVSSFIVWVSSCVTGFVRSLCVWPPVRRVWTVVYTCVCVS